MCSTADSGSLTQIMTFYSVVTISLGTTDMRSPTALWMRSSASAVDLYFGAAWDDGIRGFVFFFLSEVDKATQRACATGLTCSTRMAMASFARGKSSIFTRSRFIG